jgi:hypothetical protein
MDISRKCLDVATQTHIIAWKYFFYIMNPIQ